MGLRDSYSYHSMDGGWGGDQMPGDSKKESPKEPIECEECEEEKRSTSKRKHEFNGQMLCAECVDQLQKEKEEEDKRAVLRRIRGEETLEDD